MALRSDGAAAAPWEIDEELLKAATPEELAAYRAALRAIVQDWHHAARPEQLPPPGAWPVWFVQGGRGSGKTRTGAETLAEWIRTDPPAEWFALGPTDGHARKVQVFGDSGLRNALPDLNPHWNGRDSALELSNGSVIYCDGANDGAPGMQGHNFRGGWADEIGKWSRHRWKEAWSEGAVLATRIGRSQIVATATPKQGHPLVIQLVKDPTVVKTRMRTRDNAANLSEEALAEFERLFRGTRLGRQELDGELLEDITGALWSLALLEELRVELDQVPSLERIVVAIDPAVSVSEGSDLTGIIGAGIGPNPERPGDLDGYVLEDWTVRASPDAWAKRAVDLYYQLEADLIVAEVNNGGDMVLHTIKTVDPNVPVKLVHATRGKALRAEPIAALYEQGRVHHVGEFPELESQLTTWVPHSNMKSPDRMDAVVWALTELMTGRRRSTASVTSWAG